jgi:hypothetical protein
MLQHVEAFTWKHEENWAPSSVNSEPEQFIHWNRCSACAMRYWPCLAAASPYLTAAEQRHVLRARQRTQPCWSWRWQKRVFWALGDGQNPDTFGVSVFKSLFENERCLGSSDPNKNRNKNRLGQDFWAKIKSEGIGGGMVPEDLCLFHHRASVTDPCHCIIYNVGETIVDSSRPVPILP